ncbi:hypothetical protein DSUL_60180 [Desulfovibrionales bacterium]
MSQKGREEFDNPVTIVIYMGTHPIIHLSTTMRLHYNNQGMKNVISVLAYEARQTCNHTDSVYTPRSSRLSFKELLPERLCTPATSLNTHYEVAMPAPKLTQAVHSAG